MICQFHKLPDFTKVTYTYYIVRNVMYFMLCLGKCIYVRVRNINVGYCVRRLCYSVHSAFVTLLHPF